MNKTEEWANRKRNDGFCIVVDTREQLPYSWPGVPMVKKALPIGDYSIFGLENRIAVERKSHADFVSTVTQDHQSFFAKVTAIVGGCSGSFWGLSHYMIVIEATAAALDAPMPWTRVSPATVHANLIKLAALGIPVWPAGSRARAAAWTLAYLRRAFEEIRGLHR